MAKKSDIYELLGIDVPILQAPMAGAGTPEMAAAIANAGGLGALGVALQSLEKTESDVAAFRQKSNGGLNLNFFVHQRMPVDEKRAVRARERLKPWFDRFEITDIPDPKDTSVEFDRNTCAKVIALGPKVVSFHFGLPAAELVDALRNAGIIILSSATNVEEAIWLQENGVDAVIAQGAEAGGHRGWFLQEPKGEAGTTFTLVSQIADAVTVPVIAAGGIMDGRGIRAALELGADAVQMGTVFLPCPESAISQVHKESLVTGHHTAATKGFSGGLARGLVNKYIQEFESVTDWPDFPQMNAVTGPLRKASADQGIPDAVSMWAGQGVGQIAAIEPVSEIMARLVSQLQK